MSSIAKKTWGIVLILIGLVILLTPFTPGAILLLIGIDIVFGDKWLWWRRKKERVIRFLNRNTK